MRRILPAGWTILLALGLSWSPARAQTDSVFLKTSDGATPQTRLVITTSNAGNSSQIRVENGVFRVSSFGANPVGTPGVGEIYWNTASTELRFYNGSAWRSVVSVPTGSPSGTAVLLQGATPGTQQTGHLNVSGTAIAATSFSTSGTVDLPTTTSATAGVLRVNGTHFVHGYGTANLFVGSGAGNFTMTATYNTGVGQSALASLAGTSDNTAVGALALQVCTGWHNTAVGRSALTASTTASDLVAVGYSALGANTTGFRNTAVGTYASQTSTTTGDNTAVGFGALSANTSGDHTAVGSYALYNNSTGS